MEAAELRLTSTPGVPGFSFLSWDTEGNVQTKLNLLRDGAGGVYLVGITAGTRVCHNLIHDIRSLRYGGWAIYPDEGSSELLVENNLCYNTDREIFHQHYGRNNVVRNNIFAYGGKAVLAYTRMEQHLGLTFEGNIFVARGTPVVQGVDAVRWHPDRTRFRGNLYWCEDGAVRFEGGWRTLATQPVRARLASESPRFRALPAMVRFVVTADGGVGMDWHGCERPEVFDWNHTAVTGEQEWSASLTVPRDLIEAWIRRSRGIVSMTPAEWRCLCAVALPFAALDFAAWQSHCGDRTGAVVDPLFVNPRGGDFRLRRDSPAPALGFIPFACGADRERLTDWPKGRRVE